MDHGEKISAIKKIVQILDTRWRFSKNSLCKLVKPMKRLAVRARKSFCVPFVSVYHALTEEKSSVTGKTVLSERQP